MKVLMIAEHNNQQLNPNSLKLVSCAQQLGEVDVLVIGYQCQTVAEQAAKIAGVKKVLHVDQPEYQHQLAENVSDLIVQISQDYDYILAASSSFGKNILPRVAALLNVSAISDIIAVEAPDTFLRPIYAGNAIATVQSTDPIKIITVRTALFAAAKITDISAAIETLTINISNTLSEFVGQELSVLKRPELTSARVIVSGGRGLQNGENFKLLEALADQLNAAIGASRAAVDAGFVPNDYQVGQTGKIVAPELYIAIGISGAIQHLAGMKDSKVIVAINKDPDAPIFKVADYGIVGDLFEIIPELIQQLESEPRP